MIILTLVNRKALRIPESPATFFFFFFKWKSDVERDLLQDTAALKVKPLRPLAEG